MWGIQDARKRYIRRFMNEQWCIYRAQRKMEWNIWTKHEVNARKMGNRWWFRRAER